MRRLPRRKPFCVTGAPHASAYYPRDFAWFYPDVLDPETIMDAQDAVRRVRLLEKSVRLMLEAVRAAVVTTTIVPAGRNRYIGINYFSRPSDTLLGILAGLEQLLSAEQRPTSYLAMSQGAHAGRLLLSEYREDLKRAIVELARALQRFDDNGLSALLCDVSAPRSAATDTRAERRRFVTNACVYATFLRGIKLGIIERTEHWSSCSDASLHSTRRICCCCSAGTATSVIPWTAGSRRRFIPSRSIS